MESLIKFQEELYIRMAKARTNYKKSPKERITSEYIEGRLELLEQSWLEFVCGHKEIVRTDKASENVSYNNYVKKEIYDKAEDNYFEYRLELKSNLSALSQSNQATGSVITKSCNIRLPEINIPRFSGKYRDWNTFHDLFQSLVHNNSDLRDVQKLLYLKGYLCGEAEQLLSKIPVTDINYNRCWKLLVDRYNNKRYNCHHILKRLFSQKNMIRESASGLKELIDTTNDCIASLSNIGINTNNWDVLLIHIITLKLDPESRRQWEFNATDNTTSDELPTYSQFESFLTNRYRAIEFLDSRSSVSNVPNKNQSNDFVTKTRTMHAANVHCPFCSGEHRLGNCKRFITDSVDSRREFVLTNNICFCCLGSNHSAKFCKANIKCRICNKKHNALLHPMGKGTGNDNVINGELLVNDKTSGNITSRTGPSSNRENSESAQVVSCFSSKRVHTSQVLLATALVKTISVNGQRYTIRALLDQGSQSSFITESTVQLLGLKKTPIKSQISGVGGDSNLISKAIVDIKVSSQYDQNVIINVKAYVLKSITTLLPSNRVKTMEWKELTGMILADPGYHKPSRIDILLGADIYGKIIQEGIKKEPFGSLIAQSTSLGWILSGAVNTADVSSGKINAMHCQVNDSNELLKKFWELEDDISLPKENRYNEEEKRCEIMFNQTTHRNEDGRYIVRLPFKSETPEVTNSLQIAEKRLYSLEKRLKTGNLKEKYNEAINEYIITNHMELVPKSEIHNPKAIYLPHHVVVRDDKETTKIRPVVDASCKGSNNKSLNDNLLVGPTIQSELRHIVMRWRLAPICLTADIIKMYRQVMVDTADVDYQRLLWRPETNMEVKHYRMLRVAFGVASAPYLAVKSLQQVALDDGSRYPAAAEKVMSDFYMDDLMTGCESVEEGIKLYKELNELLPRGGFHLQKWTSNNELLLKKMKECEEKETQGNDRHNVIKEGLKIKTDEIIKIVGLTWYRCDDTFRYKVDIPPLQEPATKRTIISDISRFYDPLGWAGPSIIISKIIIQKLWLAGIGWDEEVPKEILNEWLTYRETLRTLGDISIPRWIGVKASDNVELHGFCDASKDAYAAVVYSRVIDSTGKIRVALISAKTKVAPVKQISIPRLELCGAVLLARLLTEVASVMKIEKTQLHAWTDSTVVLAWLNGHPSRWKVFVANRVTEIVGNLDSHHWSHISSKCNPADGASRGLLPAELINCTMWFKGPDFLHQDRIAYQKPKDNNTDLEMVKIKSHCTIVRESIWERFSSLTRMKRVITYCRRFINNSRKDRPTEKRIGYLTAQELNETMNCFIRQCQADKFSEDIAALKKQENLPKRSKLRALNPFLDEHFILRVGGRLQNSQLTDCQKHPVLIPRKSHLTDILIADAHKQTLHGGPQLMMCYLQSKYWILGSKQLVKSYFRKCVTCVKHTGNIQTQLMGQLPTVRVTPTRAFKSSGVDYAGPIYIRTAKGRGHKAHKGYICLFVCMATRAVHLEVVTDLTMDGFLQAFKRFVARRGNCSDLWSDNATNFTGADNELRRLFQLEKKSLFQDIAEVLATNACTWHFIPSRSPNFGGLWEAGVKSVKYHLKRVIGQSTLTFEEISTVLAQIEACLNSRPLSVINCNEGDDVTVLTPGHFLIGEALVTPPDKNFESSNVTSLRRWQYTQRMLQDFWRQWSRQYLTKFYQRYRWSSQHPQPKIGDVVIVKEDNLPPCRWLYGRVVATHPGDDNIVRVVTLKVKSGTLKRAVSKICLLPVTD